MSGTLPSAFLDQAPTIVFAKDTAGRYVSVNLAFEALLGLTPGQALGRRDADLFPPERAAILVEHDARVGRSGVAETFEEDVPGVNGPHVWLVCKFPLRDAAGAISGLGGIATEITRNVRERQTLEETARMAAQRFQLATEAARIGIWDWDIKADRWYASPTYFTMLGYPAEAGYSDRQVWLERLHPADRDYVAAKIRAVLQLGASSYEYEARMRHADGSYRWVNVAGRVLARDEQGKPSRMLGIRSDVSERKLAEEALQLESAALEAAANAIFITGRDGVIQWVNPAFTAASGYAANEAVGQKPHLIKSAAHPPAFFQTLWETILRGRVWRGQITNRRKDGSLYVSEQTIAPVKDQRGEITHFVCVQQDITEQKEAEQARDHSLSLMLATLESTADGILVVNTAGKIETFNRVFARMWRLPDEVLATKDDARAMRWALDQLSDPERFTEKIRHLYAHPLEESFDTIEFKDGRLFERYSRPQLVGGSVVGRVWSFRDVTERERADEELRWRTAFFEAQVDSALDGILVVDSTGKKILQNRRMGEVWKIPPEIAEDKDDNPQSAFVASRTKHPKQFTEKVAYLYSHPTEISREEIELVDGTILDRYSAPVRDKAGKYYGRIWTFRDVTEQKRLEEHLRPSQKMDAIGQLSGGVAHDFNNLLTAIMGHLGLLETNLDVTPEIAESLAEIGKAANRAATLTSQLLAFSRRQILQSSDLDLNEVVEHMTKMLRRLVGEDVTMQLDYAPEQMNVHGDASMLEQVLLNLAVNARDAMSGGGTLRIATRGALRVPPQDQARHDPAKPIPVVHLAVSDTGSGIAPEVLPRIFEPFFTTKEVGKGTGLGLATVFGSVQQHRGWIEVESAVGRGTTFHVFLPRIAARISPAVESAPAAAPRGRGETILLVEDEPAVREMGTAALTRHGYLVLTANTGAEALEVWVTHKGKIHLLLTDLIMPGGMSGLQLAREVLKKNSGVRVIYTSGYSAEIAGRDLPMKSGINYLAKPYELNTLLQTVRNALDGGESRPPF